MCQIVNVFWTESKWNNLETVSVWIRVSKLQATEITLAVLCRKGIYKGNQVLHTISRRTRGWGLETTVRNSVQMTPQTCCCGCPSTPTTGTDSAAYTTDTGHWTLEIVPNIWEAQGKRTNGDSQALYPSISKSQCSQSNKWNILESVPVTMAA